MSEPDGGSGSGDDVALFAALYRVNYESVLRYALRRASEQNAHDVASEVFLVAWRRLSDMPDHPLPWLIATARRVLANQRRGQLRRDALYLRLRAEPPADLPSAADQVDTHERWAAALRSLNPSDQEVLALRVWDGLSAADAAASLGCSRSAFAMRLNRARRRLAQALQEPPTTAAMSARAALTATEEEHR